MDLPPQPDHLGLADEILALREQISEISNYHENGKGKYCADAIPDHDSAFAVFEEEIAARIGLLNDQNLAQSIARAIYTDSQIITAAQEEETRASIDREIARRVNAGEELHGGALSLDTDSCDPTCPGEGPSTANTAWDSDGDAQMSTEAGPSMSYVQQQEEAIKQAGMGIQCCACYDQFKRHEMTRLKCRHHYCRDCLKRLFLNATKDESLFPPRCCKQPIPIPFVQGDMSGEELEAFKRAEVEFTTTDRTYCSNKTCGEFIPPRSIIGDRADCPLCGSVTCKMCKNGFHLDDCPEDHAVKATLSLAANEGWQRCFQCRALVELGTGCYHITCKCRAEFCYLCGAAWKTCSCEIWAEERLLERAREVVDREAVQPLPQQVRQERVQEMQEHLRENHECEHSRRFQRILGNDNDPFECELCGDWHSQYILQCRRCHVRVCEDCRRHRI